jgi:hypothetical protein
MPLQAGMDQIGGFPVDSPVEVAEVLEDSAGYRLS